MGCGMCARAQDKYWKMVGIFGDWVVRSGLEAIVEWQTSSGFRGRVLVAVPDGTSVTEVQMPTSEMIMNFLLEVRCLCGVGG